MSVTVIAGEIMDLAAPLLNDAAKEVYNYGVQLPYLKISLKELRELFELNNMPVTDSVSIPITVPIGAVSIGFDTVPALPSNLVSIEKIWESNEDLGDYVPMTRKNFLPHYMEGTDTSSFSIWSWEGNAIKLLPSLRPNDLKIDYIRELFPGVIDQNSTIAVINAELFLSFRTAALCAQFIEENKTRSDDLNGMAYESLDRISGIETKAKQTIGTRHRPFRASYKSRGSY